MKKFKKSALLWIIENSKFAALPLAVLIILAACSLDPADKKSAFRYIINHNYEFFKRI